jgi:non-ribosomal peptide synthetase-like protein
MSRKSDARLQLADCYDPASLILQGLVGNQENQPDNLLVCHEWDNTIRWQPGERLHHLFERRVDEFGRENNAQHLAVDSIEGQWSYQALDERANQVARYLKLQNWGDGDAIGLLFDKSVHSYVAMLAVLKVNAAYVPLDPIFPKNRITYISGDASLKSILTLSQFESLALESGAPTLCLDKLSVEIDTLAKTRLADAETGQATNELCYIIYTSGSTGNPKGVPITQASICNFVRVAAEVYGYRCADRVYQGLTIAFDFAVEEIWVPLIIGATLLPNRTGTSLLGSDLANFLLENKATALCCVPTLLASINEDIPDLRLLIVSGEACPQDLIKRWHTSERTILNAYGPTETTVTATLSRPKPDQPITIGKPLPTYSVIILEPGTKKILPFGKEGEIAIAGIGVAQGYLNRPDQTQQAFIKDFLAIKNNPTGLIYRTGDIGLINENGDIEYRGRIDLQVKIRGYRIELTEIESVILKIPQIAQAVVDTFEPYPGVKELVAYYTLQDDVGAIAQETLIAELRTVLPNYMVPSYYEHLAVMPLMACDKADRKALPKPSSKRMNAGQRVIVEPRTTMEAVVTEVLADLLELDAVSTEEDFFDDLGTDSLLIAMFGAAVREQLPNIDVSMRDFYAYPSVAKLAAHLDRKPSVQYNGSKVDKFRIPSKLDYYTCGTVQLATYFLFICFATVLLMEVIPWIFAARSPVDLYLRLCGFFAGSFFVWTSLAIAAKWILVGVWKTEKIPIWSFKYYRFWLIKHIIQSSPVALFKGYPLYNAYLRLMGAKIGKNVVMECQLMPFCADLLNIADNTILRNDSVLVSYKARSNYIYTGPISLGKNVIVGEGSVIDINTVMENGAQLGHASCLNEGQTIFEDKRYHGNPAEETSTDFRSCDEKQVSSLRQVIYSLGQLLNRFFGVVPLLILLMSYLVTITLPKYEPLTQPWALHILLVTLVASLSFFLLGLLLNTVIPRVLNRFLKVNRSYVLYGFHFMIFKMIQKFTNSATNNLVFGDSSFIVYYMKLVGYKLSWVIQTGSNFGLEHKHDNPYLCNFGSGTMISDGFSMLNVHESSTAFRLAKTSVGDDNFIGNNVFYPAKGKTGNNCLIATKAMVPVEGKIHENVGLLGSPCFEIPRTVERSPTVEPATKAVNRLKGVRRKNWHNLRTITGYLISRFAYTYITLMVFYAIAHSWVTLGLFDRIVIVNLFLIFSIGYFIIVERATFAFGGMTPIIVSIYDKKYWQVERVWKSSETFLRGLWLGTPFRSIINRLLGIKQGKMVFDDGLYASEKTMLEIGDYCNFNTGCVLQSHSLEDGIYKSDYIKVGSQCSIETKAFVHYGVTVGNDVIIGADSFVMKGEHLANRTIWGDNPAKALGRL